MNISGNKDSKQWHKEQQRKQFETQKAFGLIRYV